MPILPQKIIVIGTISIVRTLSEGLKENGAHVDVAESLSAGRRIAEEIVPNQIICFLPGRVEDVAYFADELYKHPKFAGTKIVYIGDDVIEGGDKKMLFMHRVKTLTLGPLPTSEMVRAILR